MFQVDDPRVIDAAADERADQAERLNRTCLCHPVDHRRLDAALSGAFAGEVDGAPAGRRLTHPHLFSDTSVYVAQADLRLMAGLSAAVERVVALPAWRQRVLAHAPASARHVPAAAGAFLGYDFHLSAHGPQLIEINTNAGGGLLNARLLAAGHGCGHSDALPDGGRVEADFVETFRTEWHLSRGEAPLRRIAIIDEAPATQFLFPEFRLFREMFGKAGIDALIADPRELRWQRGRLWIGAQAVDLVYNRLTDFGLDLPQNAALRAAWLHDAVVLTPHPHAHALYADKRNLVALADAAWLREIGVAADDRALLRQCVPAAEPVTAENADRFWSGRRAWFFKPAAGYGGKAAYRGDKLTRRVFSEIVQGGYIAQALVPPSLRRVRVDGAERELKLDVRNYVYRGRVQLVSARLYQGQTTNFRTHGGGFAAVVAV